ncbi:MAG TPA: SIMPL domain-containing protein [Flavipsychrobacter sp.]|nr:SIMPL domain-containing protein [Flavipsychrobacter sp.]
MINKFIVLFVGSLFAFAAISHAQPQQNEKPYIEVSGNAEKEVVPDEIYIAITLTERYDGRNKITIDDQEEQLKQSIKGLGIDVSNLSLSNADASYVKINWLSKDVMAKKSYLLKVSSADMVSKVFQQLENLNIKDASVSRVDYSKREELKKELRIEALKKAKDEAEYMLQGIGQIAGNPLYVRESGNYYAPRMNTMAMAKNVNNASNNAGEVSGDNDYIEFKKIMFQTTVDARFEIK